MIAGYFNTFDEMDQVIERLALLPDFFNGASYD